MLSRPLIFYAMAALYYASPALAAPSPLEARAAVCDSGIYGELAPLLKPYALAQAFCTINFPVKCTKAAAIVKRASTTSKTPTTTSAKIASTTLSTTKATTTATSKTTSSADSKASAWSKCQGQCLAVISTMCSCIESAKPCTFSSATASPKPSTTSSKPTTTSSVLSTTSSQPTTTSSQLTTTSSMPTTTLSITSSKPTTSATTTQTTTASTTCDGRYATAIAADGGLLCSGYRGGGIAPSFIYDTSQSRFVPYDTEFPAAVAACTQLHVNVVSLRVYLSITNGWTCESSSGEINCAQDFMSDPDKRQIYTYHAVDRQCCLISDGVEYCGY